MQHSSAKNFEIVFGQLKPDDKYVNVVLNLLFGLAYYFIICGKFAQNRQRALISFLLYCY